MSLEVFTFPLVSMPLAPAGASCCEASPSALDCFAVSFLPTPLSNLRDSTVKSDLTLLYAKLFSQQRGDSNPAPQAQCLASSSELSVD